MATRCDSYGCARIVCHDHGNRCYRTDAYDDRYSRSGYDRYRDSDRDYRYRYGRYHHDDAYSRYDRDGASWRYDCNHDGDRCTVRREPEGEW
ncbi:MAG: hypothetical protein KGJ79_15110 [Alphaproteobacteria bacterium]|nr:hypothetical protein [Alphaproteobacteria bacterium]MDE2493993.1 hypothetical protein [Alphaproteobacteria bacterium]